MTESKKKEFKKSFIRFIVIILVIHLFLVLSRCTVVEERMVPVESLDTNETTVMKPTQECNKTEYEWDYEWGEWYPEYDQQISVGFTLINKENRPGVFKVNFAFFDESEYKYDNYENRHYDSVRDELEWDYASMWMNGIDREIESGDSVMIIANAKKKNPASVYWVYADVKPPVYDKCVTKFTTSLKNITTTVTQNKSRNVTTTKSLWDILISYMAGE